MGLRPSLGLALALATSLATPVAAATETSGVDGAVQARPVATQTWMVQGLSAMGSAANRNFISNAAFVVTPEGVVVVDALGSPPLAQALLAEIRRVTPLPILAVVVTHCHADHIYGLQVFQDAGAQIVAHRGCRDYMTSETAERRLALSREELFPWVDEKTRLVMPTLWLGHPPAAGGEPAEELVLPWAGGRFRLMHAGPSHTPEDLVLHDARTGVLFAGDLVFRGRIPFVGQADSRGWIRALDRILALRPALLVPGHGPASEQPGADLQLTRDYLAHLRKTMGDAAQQMAPFDEAYAQADWSRFDRLPLFAAANRINAYNTYLLMEQEKP